MITVKNAESRFVTGTDCSPSWCVYAGYLSVWKVNKKIVLAKICQVADELFSVQYSTFNTEQDMKQSLFETWTSVPRYAKGEALEYLGLADDSMPSLLAGYSSVNPDDFFTVAELLLAIGYLDWDVQEYKPTYLRAMDFTNTYERTKRKC